MIEISFSHKNKILEEILPVYRQEMVKYSYLL